jgi:hypothetical protein
MIYELYIPYQAFLLLTIDICLRRRYIDSKLQKPLIFYQGGLIIMKDDKKNRIQWFIDFINLDIGNITEGDRRKWIFETTCTLVHGRHDVPKLEILKGYHEYFNKRQKTLRQPGKLKNCQEHLKSFFSRLMDRIVQIKSEGQEIKLTRKYGGNLVFAEFNNTPKLRVQVRDGWSGKYETRERDVGGFATFWQVDPEELDKSTIHIQLKGPTFADTLLFNFLQSLEGIPIGALRQCPECGSYYFHISKKKKIYCSNKCAARKASREKRKRRKEEKPELYEQMKEKAQDRAHESYKRKKEAEVPGSKVQRRPRKKI